MIYRFQCSFPPGCAEEAGNMQGLFLGHEYTHLPISILYSYSIYIFFCWAESWRRAQTLWRSILGEKLSAFSSCLISPWALTGFKVLDFRQFLVAHLPPSTFPSPVNETWVFFTVNKKNLCRIWRSGVGFEVIIVLSRVMWWKHCQITFMVLRTNARVSVSAVGVILRET